MPRFRRSAKGWGPRATFGALLVCLVACGTSRPFVWADDVEQPPEPQGGYRIEVGDVLAVQVWNQESMSTPRTAVRDDGKVSLPFLRDVHVVGLSPGELAQRLEVELEKFVLKPVVTVTLEERAALSISVLGEVARPGSYDLSPGAGVLHAIAAAGGLTEYARRDEIYLLRQQPPGGDGPTRVRFRYEALTGGARSAAFLVRRGDVVVVE